MVWLFVEILLWCLLTFLLGIAVGWLMWGRRPQPESAPTSATGADHLPVHADIAEKESGQAETEPTGTDDRPAAPAEQAELGPAPRQAGVSGLSDEFDDAEDDHSQPSRELPPDAFQPAADRDSTDTIPVPAARDDQPIPVSDDRHGTADPAPTRFTTTAPPGPADQAAPVVESLRGPGTRTGDDRAATTTVSGRVTVTRSRGGASVWRAEADEPDRDAPTGVIAAGVINAAAPRTLSGPEAPTPFDTDPPSDHGSRPLTTPGVSTGGDAGAADVIGLDEPGATAISGAVGGAGPRIAERDLTTTDTEVITAAEEPYGPGSTSALADGSAPSEQYAIKGNPQSMLYHPVGSPYFGRTKAEVWFKTAADAERAGFQPWNRARVGSGATAVAALTHEQGPYPRSALPKPDGAPPSGEFTVKGNADSMLFHTTDSPYFTRTRAEVWFRDAADAEAAGFTAWNKRRVQPPQRVGSVVAPGPYPGSAMPTEDGTAPAEEYTIKGNLESMLFHTPHSPFYAVTRAQVWFKAEADAEDAGFRSWMR